MSTNYANKLASLQFRRTGGTNVFSKHMSMEAFADSAMVGDQAVTESYQVRAGNKPATTFALGAMQEVESHFTRAALAEADRVKRYLQTKLRSQLKAKFELQGSVPLNLHIEGISDVDLLCFRTDYRTYSPNGTKAADYGSWPSHLKGLEPADWLQELRNDVERHLLTCYGEMNTVNTTSNKSIGLSGPSFSVKVDVVPAHWYLGVEYQSSGDDMDKGVCIYIKDQHTTSKNYPFRYMREINSVDMRSAGGTKAAIRLMKNLKADSDAKKNIRLLSSYDIASLIWHLNPDQLLLEESRELRVMAHLEKELDIILSNESRLFSLKTPDNTRLIIDKKEKIDDLKILIQELKGLNKMISEENLSSPSQEALSVLMETTVPIY